MCEESHRNDDGWCEKKEYQCNTYERKMTN